MNKKLNRRLREGKTPTSRCYAYILNVGIAPDHRALAEAKVVFHNLSAIDYAEYDLELKCPNAKHIIKNFNIHNDGNYYDKEYMTRVSYWTKEEVELFKEVFCTWDDTTWNNWLAEAKTNEERTEYGTIRREAEVLSRMIESFNHHLRSVK